MLNEILQKLLSVYSKNPLSNIGKLLTILSDQLDDVKDNLETIELYRCIDNATGKTLDLIGTNVNQFRGTSTDEVYRVLIKSRIATGLSTGDINSIISILSIALGVEPTEIGIKQLYEDNSGTAAIEISSVPISRLNEVGMSGEQFVMIVKKIAAAGIRVEPIELSGTFSFASGSSIETDAEAGFSDTAGTTGGYFGAIFETNVHNLPI